MNNNTHTLMMCAVLPCQILQSIYVHSLLLKNKNKNSQIRFRFSPNKIKKSKIGIVLLLCGIQSAVHLFFFALDVYVHVKIKFFGFFTPSEPISVDGFGS